MGSSRPSFSIEELLVHADWLRRLAGHLVAQQGGREHEHDALQDTWVAALRSPPGRDGSPQPWLREVLKNFLRRSVRRDRVRLKGDEQLQAETSLIGSASPEMLLERAEAQRLLVDLVVGLDEPFRSTVLLRYFEGLTAAEIARSQHVPAGTVRWRLKQALDRLRASLDAMDRREGKRWLLMLSPLVDRGAEAPLALTGGLLVSLKKKVALLSLILALLAAGAAWRWLWPHEPVATQAPVANPQRRPAAGWPSLPAIQVPRGEFATDDSKAGSVDGRIVSSADGRGVPGAEVVLSSGGPSLALRADPEGRFRFAPDQPGQYSLARASAEGFIAFSPDWGDSPIGFNLRPGERIRDVQLALRPRTTCLGTVVDELDKPVSGAAVTIWNVGRVRLSPAMTMETDNQGRFQFPITEPAYIEARHGERFGREQANYAVFTRCALRVRLGARRDVQRVSISGRVEDLNGRPVPGAIVEGATDSILEPSAYHAYARTESGPGGGFELGPLDPTLYKLTVRMAAYEVALLRDVKGGSRDIIVRVGSPGHLRGQVRNGKTGGPVTSFTLVLSRSRGPLDVQMVGAFTRYDAKGSFELEDLPAGRYKVVAAADAFAPSSAATVDIVPDPAPAAEMTIELQAGGRLHGRVIDRNTRQPIVDARVAMEGNAGVAAMAPLARDVRTTADGRFEIVGVGPGFISLLVSGAGHHHGRVMGGLQIPAGGSLGPVEVDLAPSNPGEQPRIEFTGIGAALSIRAGTIVLGAVTPGGGAALAGLVSGDAILSVDGQPVAEMNMGGAVARIRGPEGTTVTLRVRRASGQEADVQVTRRLLRGP